MVSPECYELWKKWAAANHRSVTSLVEALPFAWDKGHLFWLDSATFDALVGSVQDRLTLRVERATKRMVREELHRQGFTLTQYDK